MVKLLTFKSCRDVKTIEDKSRFKRESEYVYKTMKKIFPNGAIIKYGTPNLKIYNKETDKYNAVRYQYVKPSDYDCLACHCENGIDFFIKKGYLTLLTYGNIFSLVDRFYYISEEITFKFLSKENLDELEKIKEDNFFDFDKECHIGDMYNNIKGLDIGKFIKSIEKNKKLKCKVRESEEKNV